MWNKVCSNWWEGDGMSPCTSFILSFCLCEEWSECLGESCQNWVLGSCPIPTPRQLCCSQWSYVVAAKPVIDQTFLDQLDLQVVGPALAANHENHLFQHRTHQLATSALSMQNDGKFGGDLTAPHSSKEPWMMPWITFRPPNPRRWRRSDLPSSFWTSN